MTLASVCWAARPTTTAVTAPPSASVRGLKPATRSATTMTRHIVTSRMRNPTVPAVPGSRRLNSHGPSARPTARAKCQPSATRTTAVAIRTAVSHSRPEQLLAAAVDEQHAREQREQDQRLDPRSAHRAPREPAGEGGLAPRARAGMDELLQLCAVSSHVRRATAPGSARIAAGGGVTRRRRPRARGLLVAPGSGSGAA